MVREIVIDRQNKKLLLSVTSLDRGTSSEKNLILKLLKNEIPSKAVFHDLMIRKGQDEFSQIDLVLATKQGIIVFEVKDYKGWIFGSGNHNNWTQVLAYGKRKFRFYNPVKQNKNHINNLIKFFVNYMKTVYGTKKGLHFCKPFCSPSWARTKDPLINSQML